MLLVGQQHFTKFKEVSKVSSAEGKIPATSDESGLFTVELGNNTYNIFAAVHGPLSDQYPTLGLSFLRCT